MTPLPYEIAVKDGAHKGEGGKVVGFQQSGHGLFYLVHFWNSHGELTAAPPLKDLVNSRFCRVVVEGGRRV